MDGSVLGSSYVFTRVVSERCCGCGHRSSLSVASRFSSRLISVGLGTYHFLDF